MSERPGPWRVVDLRKQRGGQIALYDADGRHRANVLSRHADCCETSAMFAAAPDALWVLGLVVEGAQRVAAILPEGQDGSNLDRLLNVAMTVEIPADIIRDALDVLKKAGRR